MSEFKSRVPLPPCSYFMGWGTKYATEADVEKYALQRDEEHRTYNASKDKHMREQVEPLRNYIAELKEEKRTLQKENEKLQAKNQELQVELKNQNGKRARSDEDEAEDSKEAKKRRLDSIKRVFEDACKAALEQGNL